MTTFTRNWPRLGLALAAFGLAAAPLAAQVETIDPNNAIDGDLVEQPGDQPVYGDPAPTPSYTPPPRARRKPMPTSRNGPSNRPNRLRAKRSTAPVSTIPRPLTARTI